MASSGSEPSRPERTARGWRAAAALALLAACAAPSPDRAMPPDRPGWANNIADYLPAIGRCLEAPDVSGIAVSKAWRVARAMVGVRAVGADGGRHDCIAAADGTALVMVEKVPAGSHLDGEGMPLFMPEGHVAPADGCHADSSARDGQGRVVGVLRYETCAPGLPRELRA